MPAQAHIGCSGCRTTLAYPVGATCVRCPLCRVTTYVNQVHIRCVTCSIQLALPATAQLAQCPRCRTVMTMPRHPLQQRAGQAPQQPNVPPPPPKTVVVIEQPETTENGKRVKNTALGTRIDDGVF
uniref:Zinc finger LSD1-type domain-containing protein n=1 Tax=Neobodo designis TaxID=312471 RepID=A0A7S1QD90_NEODS|mmetsp:Transcript_4201/g.13396  ORF Transcript_4201/g.13396 Transcript_4201/m.13396 type:complete len:126 (+) Transcript_4201:167-544(+)